MIKQKDEVVARIRSHRKRMKADGFMRAEVDYALWVRKGADAEGDVAMRLRIAQWLGQPLGYQASFDLQTEAAQ